MHRAARLALVPPDEVPIPPCCSEAALEQVSDDRPGAAADDSNSLLLERAAPSPLSQRRRRKWPGSSCAPSSATSTVPNEVLAFCGPPEFLEFPPPATIAEEEPAPLLAPEEEGGSPRWESNKDAWYLGDQSGVSLLDKFTSAAPAAGTTTSAAATIATETEGAAVLVREGDNALVSEAIHRVERLERQQSESKQQCDGVAATKVELAHFPPQDGPGLVNFSRLTLCAATQADPSGGVPPQLVGTEAILPALEAYADRTSLSSCWNPFAGAAMAQPPAPEEAEATSYSDEEEPEVDTRPLPAKKGSRSNHNAAEAEAPHQASPPRALAI